MSTNSRIFTIYIFFFANTANDKTYLKAVVRPRSKLHFTALIVEGEPSDVDLAGALEDTRWYVEARAVFLDHYVSWIRAVEALVGAAKGQKEKNKRDVKKVAIGQP